MSKLVEGTELNQKGIEEKRPKSWAELFLRWEDESDTRALETLKKYAISSQEGLEEDTKKESEGPKLVLK